MGWKYVMLKRGVFLTPIIFPDRMVHQDMAYLAAVHLSNGRAVEVVSAGSIEALLVGSTTDRSSTLNLGSNPEDRNTINAYPYQHGIE